MTSAPPESPEGAAPWWKTAVVYQIYPRSFQDSNGDGVGDLNGITARLDDLVALGVDALWLSPVQRSPMADFGYDISDYRAIDPCFGTMEDFDRLVAEAHARGLKLLLDVVVNHTSEQHPWFEAARRSRSSPKRDWYLWHEGPRPPNNWRSVFGGSAWQRDAHTGDWYLHTFLKEQPDLNWRNPAVRQAVMEDLEFWLRRGVDGFRLDVFNLWLKDPALRDNPPRWWGWRYPRPYDWQWHLHDGFHADLHPVLRDLRVMLDRWGATAVGEAYLPDGCDPARAAVYLGQGDALPLVFDFSSMDTPWSAPALQRMLARWMDVTQAPNWPCLVFSNHDQVRGYSRLGRGVSPREAEARARVTAALLLLCRGTPFLYYGEEIGMTQQRLPRRALRDPVGLRYWPFNQGRDGARTPMAWDGGLHGGFSQTTPWLPLHADFATKNVAAQRSDPDSLWHWYARLLRLRRAHPALQLGDWEAIAPAAPDTIAFTRTLDADRWLVLAHCARRGAEVSLPEGAWQWRCGTGAPRPALHARATLAPYEVLVLQRT